MVRLIALHSRGPYAGLFETSNPVSLVSEGAPDGVGQTWRTGSASHTAMRSGLSLELSVDLNRRRYAAPATHIQVGRKLTVPTPKISSQCMASYTAFPPTIVSKGFIARISSAGTLR